MKYNKKIIGSIAIAAVIIIFSIAGYINSRTKSYDYSDIFVEDKQQSSTDKNSNYEEKSSSTVAAASNIEIKVEIKGEIKKPGVYTLEADSRLQDLIAEAGGLKKDADTDDLPSLAKKLKDEDCIIIYNKKQEKNKSIPAMNESSTESDSENEGDQEIININTASLEDLQKIKGVGPVTAQNILDYREKNGDFKTIEDLKNVDRIGDKTFEKMKDSITVQ